eukprot:TRINITY_DN11581_c0_g1_i1.p1 TRINITY_DN11581_c0_g1~~TRINITY_DN11581_c0_g1_i1.p1  ORF type:complete len:125 (+),score=15.75 TRINITY_DN11581_c0_g1_i1:422-796(+)
MVRDAERFKAEDEEKFKKVESRNKLEGYAYNVRNSLNEEALRNKMSTNDRERVDGLIKETLKWLDENPAPPVDESESKLRDIEQMWNPIMSKLGSEGATPMGPTPTGSTPTGGASSGPSVEEVD